MTLFRLKCLGMLGFFGFGVLRVWVQGAGLQGDRVQTWSRGFVGSQKGFMPAL